MLIDVSPVKILILMYFNGSSDVFNHIHDNYQ